MPWLDYALIAILVVSTLISLARGFVREAFSLAIWIVAFWIAWTFFPRASVSIRILCRFANRSFRCVVCAFDDRSATNRRDG